jgi:hypothetical protein
VKVMCAWCIREGMRGFLREKAPLDDPSETHGLCEAHFHRLRSTTAPADVLELGSFRTLTRWLSALFIR